MPGRKILLALFAVAVVLLLVAQDKNKFIVNGRLTSDDGKTDGATISVSKDGGTEKTVVPAKSGKFDFEFDYNHEYRITFNREGFFQKIVIISTFVPDEVLKNNDRFPPLPFVLNLFKEVDEIDKTFTIKPVARIFYNARIDNFDAEIYFSDTQLREQIQEAIQQNLALAAERKTISKADELEHAALEKAYDEAIADADAFYHKNEFQLAIDKFREALNLFPDRPYPRDRIAELQDVLAALELTEDVEKSYREAIAEGNRLFTETRYDGAVAAYQRALDIKANDKYARDRLNESNRLLAQQQTQLRYNELIAQADQQFNANALQPARDLYIQAKTVLPDEAYPTQQINRIDRQLKQNQELERLLTEANNAFENQQYMQAKLRYQDVLQIRADHVRAKNRLAEIDQILKQQATDQQYASAITLADQAYAQKQFGQAKTGYQQALELKPEENYPKNQLARIDAEQNRLREQAESIEKAYLEAMQQGTTELEREAFDAARQAFVQAKDIKPEEQLPDEMIARVDSLQRAKELAAVEALAREQQQKELNEKYLAAIAEGDRLFQAESWQQAKTAYQTANSLKPAETYPPAQIQAIDSKLAQITRQTGAYNAAIAAADQFFQQQGYAEAATKYEEALLYFPDERYPKMQILRINEILAQQVAAQKLNEAYQAKIKEADEFFAQANFRQAKTAYTTASGLKPAEQYPKDKIREIDEKLQQMANEEAAQAKLEASYRQAIAQADQQFGQQEWQPAKASYQSAIGFKPDEAYPKQRIEEIDRQLALLAQVELQRRQQAQADSLARAQLEASYRQAIAQADRQFNQQEWQPAKTSYQTALGLKSNEAYPKQRIEEIDRRLALLAQAERERKQQAQADSLAQAQLEASYRQAIDQADRQFNQQEWQPAKASYQTALGLKPNEAYPKQRVEEIDRQLDLLAQAELQRRQQAQADSLAQAQLEASYRQAIAQADQQFGQQEWQPAKASYQTAIGLKPNEAYPKQRVEEIDRRLALLAQAELERKQQAQADSLAQAQLDANYRQAIAQADQQFGQQEWQPAKASYQTALGLKPNEAYPKQRIEEIDRQLALLARAERERKQQAQADSLARAQLEASYRQAIAQADQQFGQQEWQPAKVSYQSALGLKPNEAYPKQRIEEIDRQLDLLAQAELQRRQQAQADSLAKARLAAFNQKMAKADVLTNEQLFSEAIATYHEAIVILPEKTAEVNAKITEVENLVRILEQLEANYRQAITQGDQQFDRQEWTQAKGSYQQALGIKPQETYPARRIKEIDQKLLTLQEEATRMRAASQSSDHYQTVILQADENFERKDYVVARFYYYQAAGIQPENPYPKERITAISKLIDQSLTAEQLKAYNDAITRADAEFEKNNYTVARFYYSQALSVKSWEQYPKEQIDEISRLTNSLLSQREEEEYQNLVTNGDEAFYKKEMAVARSYFQRALSIKKDDQYAAIKLKEIQQAMDQEKKIQEDREYQLAVSEADKAYENRNYSVARFYYNKAQTLRPNENYPKEQLDKIRQALQ